MTYTPHLDDHHPIPTGQWIAERRKSLRPTGKVFCPRRGCQRLLAAVYCAQGREWMWVTGSRSDDREIRADLVSRNERACARVKAVLEEARADGDTELEHTLAGAVARREELIRQISSSRFSSQTPPMAWPMGHQPWPTWHDDVVCPGCHYVHRLEVTDSGQVIVSGTNAVL